MRYFCSTSALLTPAMIRTVMLRVDDDLSAREARIDIKSTVLI